MPWRSDVTQLLQFLCIARLPRCFLSSALPYLITTLSHIVLLQQEHNMNKLNLRDFDVLTSVIQLDGKSNIPRRGQPNKLGKEVNIGLNTFHVLSYPTRPVHQYDIDMVPKVKTQDIKRLLIAKIWKSKAVQAKLGTGNWIFDGNKLAWYVLRVICLALFQLILFR